MTWTYDPTQITAGGKDQMRFELGDTVVDMEGISAALCDEEYDALLSAHGGNWKAVRFHCLKAIVMKLSYEVDTSVGGLSYSLHQRYERWKKLYDEAKKDLVGALAVPMAGDPTSLSPYGGTPYFYNDMQANPRRF